MSAPAPKRERVVGENEKEAAPSSTQKAKSGNETTKTKKTGKRWTQEQDDALRKAVEEFGQRNWKVGRDQSWAITSQCLIIDVVNR